MWSGCAPALDGYGPECNRTGDGHRCGLEESPAEGYLAHKVAELLVRQYGEALVHSHGPVQQVKYARAREVVSMVREFDKEEGYGW